VWIGQSEYPLTPGFGGLASWDAAFGEMRSSIEQLLDDVFVTSDDERARSGMRLLIELATTHQIVLLTCHRRRYDAMAEVDRELYQGRVQWLDARSVGAERNAGELTG